MIGWILGGAAAVGGLYALTRKGKGKGSGKGVVSTGSIELSTGGTAKWRVVRTSSGYQGQFSPPPQPGFAREWIRASAPGVTREYAQAAAISAARGLDPKSDPIVASDEIAEGRWRVRRLADGRYQGEYLAAGSSSWSIVVPPVASPDAARLLALEALAKGVEFRDSGGTTQSFTVEDVCRHLLEILIAEHPTVFSWDDLPTCIERAAADPTWVQRAPCILAARTAADLEACGFGFETPPQQA